MTFLAAPVWIAAAFAAGPLIPSVAATTAPNVDATRNRNDAERKATPGVLVNVCLFIFTLGRSGSLLLRAPEVQDRSTGRSLNALDDHLGDSHSLNRLAINRLAITSLVVLIHA